MDSKHRSKFWAHQTLGLWQNQTYFSTDNIQKGRGGDPGVLWGINDWKLSNLIFPISWTHWVKIVRITGYFRVFLKLLSTYKYLFYWTRLAELVHFWFYKVQKTRIIWCKLQISKPITNFHPNPTRDTTTMAFKSPQHNS